MNIYLNNIFTYSVYVYTYIIYIVIINVCIYLYVQIEDQKRADIFSMENGKIKW